MSQPTEGEQYLLEQIRQGRPDAWSQFVERYQGRLLAFARGKMRDANEAEDVLQETFVSFLRGLSGFRGQASLETFLFSILRRKIIDAYRGKRMNVCLLQDMVNDSDHSDASTHVDLPASDPTASWYARREEDVEQQRTLLAAALNQLIDAYKHDLNFRDLQVIELLFYCQLRNKDIASTVGVGVNHVAVLKHRCLKQIHEQVATALPAGTTLSELLDHCDDDTCGPADALLTEVWQEQRLSCPKRSTLGAYVLGTLEPAWRGYLQFHLERIGCRYCRANLDDLREQTQADATRTVARRIMESTVGFLNRA